MVNPSSQKGAVPEAIAAAPTTTTTAPAPTDLAPAAAPTTTGPVPTAIRVPAAGNRPLTFPDLPTSHWAYPFIKELARRGMVTGVGDGTFKPDQPVNRAQYVALLNEVLSGTRQGQSPFKDVQRGFWATEAIGAAVQAGFIKGYPDQTFQPGVPMTKMQVLLSLANGFQLPKPVETNRSLQALRDGEQIPAWAKPAIAAATEAGVVVNYPDINQFHPNQAATRAEVVTMVYQALKTTGQLPAIQSPYIFKPSIVQP
ncbi:MAG: S-layer homology domain-containing protein [Nodosilinea sp. LVE1205-7]